MSLCVCLCAHAAVKILPEHDQLVPLGGTLRLTCIDGYTPNWTRRGTHKLHGTGNRAEDIRDGQHGFSVHRLGSTASELVKNNVTVYDEAVYVCTALEGNFSSHYQLNVTVVDSKLN